MNLIDARHSAVKGHVAFCQHVSRTVQIGGSGVMRATVYLSRAGFPILTSGS
jgi:hypothetical protein